VAEIEKVTANLARSNGNSILSPRADCLEIYGSYASVAYETNFALRYLMRSVLLYTVLRPRHIVPVILR